MKKLLKLYGVSTPEEYYSIIVESFINGQRTQAIEQFNAMPATNRKHMLTIACEDGYFLPVDLRSEVIRILIQNV